MIEKIQKFLGASFLNKHFAKIKNFLKISYSIKEFKTILRRIKILIYLLSLYIFWKKFCVRGFYFFFLFFPLLFNFLCFILYSYCWPTNIFFLYAQVFSFLIRFCDLQDTMLYHWSTLLSLTTCVTYRRQFRTIGHHSHFPSNPYQRKQRISLGFSSILSMCFCPYT